MSIDFHWFLPSDLLDLTRSYYSSVLYKVASSRLVSPLLLLMTALFASWLLILMLASRAISCPGFFAKCSGFTRCGLREISEPVLLSFRHGNMDSPVPSANSPPLKWCNTWLTSFLSEWWDISWLGPLLCFQGGFFSPIRDILDLRMDGQVLVSRTTEDYQGGQKTVLEISAEPFTGPISDITFGCFGCPSHLKTKELYGTLFSTEKQMALRSPMVQDGPSLKAVAQITQAPWDPVHRKCLTCLQGSVWLAHGMTLYPILSTKRKHTLLLLHDLSPLFLAQVRLYIAIRCYQ